MASKCRAMPTMEDLLTSTKKVVGAGLIALVVLCLLLLASIVTNLNLAARVAEVADKRPIYVVPGAAEGVYAPGLTKYNVTNAARYVLSLGANLTATNAKDRLDELEKYCAPDFLPKFRLEKARLLKEIQTQTQSRAAQPERGDELTVDAKKIYTYTMSGAWEIKSGSLLMSAVRHRFTIRFSVGNADEGNPYGIQLYAFDIAPINDTGGRGQATDPAALRADKS